MAPNGKSFAAVGADRRIRIFDFQTGKMTKVIDETLQSYMDQSKQNKYNYDFCHLFNLTLGNYCKIGL